MTGFSADWLALREALDAASRAPALARHLANFLAETGSGQTLRITDLASGTGANLRYLAPALGGHQDWCLVDHDSALLDDIPPKMREWAADSGLEIRATVRSPGRPSGHALVIEGSQFVCEMRVVTADLAASTDALDLPDRSLVTASALLDLVSDAWLQGLARRCLAVRAPVLVALTYDGRIEYRPRDPDDTLLRDLVNRHQQTDKGFGPALGPAAADAAFTAFEALGFTVHREQSDWRLGPDQRPIQEALVQGWFEAAVEIAPDETARLMRWRREREKLIAAGGSTLVVGHQDLLALPPA